MKLKTANKSITPQITPFIQRNEKSLFWRLLPSIMFFSIVAIVILLIYWYYFLPRAVGQVFTEKHEIGSNRNAMIDKIMVKQGDFVHAGDLVVKLETEKLYADLKQNEMAFLAARQNVPAHEAKLQLDQDTLRLNLDDNQILRAIELYTSQSALDQARAVMDSSKADLDGAAIFVDRYGKLTPSGAVAQTQLDLAQIKYNFNTEIIKNYKQVIASDMQRRQQAEDRYNEYMKRQEGINVPIDQMMPPVETAVDVAAAQIDITKALLDYSFLKSPVDGIVSDIYKFENSGLQPGDIILAIDKVNHGLIEAYVREEWASHLYLNKKITLTPRLKNYESTKGVINYISPVVTIIPPVFLESYNQQLKEKGVRFIISLDKPWTGPAGATFDIIL